MDDMTAEERANYVATEPRAEEVKTGRWSATGEEEGVEETESGLLVVTDKRGEEDDTPKDPVLVLLRKLDHLLMVWLPQQPEWVLLLGPSRNPYRRQLFKRIARSIAKRLTTIPRQGGV